MRPSVPSVQARGLNMGPTPPHHSFHAGSTGEQDTMDWRLQENLGHRTPRQRGAGCGELSLMMLLSWEQLKARFLTQASPLSTTKVFPRV